ncbi:2-hydroxyisoflavanone dehydratase-like [Heracleum sosnowskyi]|uniref:2-hydroxyisoflavanone dehydratase-like n=1 Tax=Heracleum sosnowskyi TaxID=360622 RepID=A0AAD8M473_9APIA|nr:2-hydroxyisoflavanone dehydratase-like [Heracleum sosnowskyi]
MSSLVQMMNSPLEMNSKTTDIAHDLSPFMTVYKNGTIKKHFGSPFMPAPENLNGVRSKDVVVSSDPKVSARISLPESLTQGEKLPVLVYIHGGGFCVESALSYFYAPYASSFASNCDVMVVSVDYRLAPENPIPACYDDSWEALKWVVSHASGSGPDPWVNEHADFGRVFLAGDSAGANISHTMATWAGVKGLESDVKISGMILIHPFFGNDKPDKLWNYCCSEETGLDDPRLNPAASPGLLAKLGCNKVLISTAENDSLSSRGWTYYEALKKSEWKGEVEIVETKGMGHVFHLFDPNCEEAGSLMKLIASFIKDDKDHSLL